MANLVNSVQAIKVPVLKPDLVVLNVKGVLDLTKQQTLELLTMTVEKLEFFYDPPIAKDFVDSIGERISKEAGSLPGQYLNIYNTLILRAKFACLDILEEKEIIDLLQNYIIRYYSLDINHINIASLLSKNFSRFIWPPDTEPFAKQLLMALETNQELLGVKDLTVYDGQNKTTAKPTVSNWLKDYEGYSVGLRVKTDVTEKGGNTFARVNYVNKTSGEYKFTLQQREILTKIVELEDWLRFGWMEEYANASKETQPSEEIIKAVDEIFANSPEEDNSTSPESEVLKPSSSLQFPKVLPIVPVPKNGSENRKVGMSSFAPNFAPASAQGYGGQGKATSDLKKTASGEAIGSLTLGNKKAAPFGAAAGMSESSTDKNSISDIGNFNQKPAEAGLVNSNAMLKSGLLLNNSISGNKDLSIPGADSGFSSGGGAGNRTPRVLGSNPDSTPRHSHSDELYHSSAQIPPNRVNIQDILKNRERGEESTGGLKMGDMAVKSEKFKVESGGQISNSKFQISNKETTSPLNQSSNSGSGQASPSSSNYAEASSDLRARRGMDAGGKNSSSYILNPLLEKKPAPQNITPQPPLTIRGGGNKDAEIERKLEELKRKAGKNN